MTKPPKPKVLLIEDDAAMQAVLNTLLELEGFEVFLAPGKGSQEEIMQSIYTVDPDVILLDVRLGQVNGIEILRQLRSNSSIRQPRVVMSSGMDVMDQCMDTGANSFLLKPYMPDELIRKLRSS
jgi:DNA-binding response OmpR family regulator